MDLTITPSSIPSLKGKHALITGGSSGIGLATCQHLLAHDIAHVHLLDIKPPPPTAALPQNVTYHDCDVTHWPSLRAAFAPIPHIDLVFANAGGGQGGDPLADRFDEAGDLLEPCRVGVDLNYQSALNTAVLGIRAMRRQGSGGSVVFTSSATALSSQKGLPVYGSQKLAVIGLVRAWRHVLVKEGITVNAVAPGTTGTAMVPAGALEVLEGRGLRVSSAEHVGLAMVYSAVAREERRVEAYGRERDEENEWTGGRWNGRVIVTVGERFTEVEEPLERLKGRWFGERNLKDFRHGQRLIEDLQGGRS